MCVVYLHKVKTLEIVGLLVHAIVNCDTSKTSTENKHVYRHKLKYCLCKQSYNYAYSHGGHVILPGYELVHMSQYNKLSMCIQWE